jgi:hypothetical protein
MSQGSQGSSGSKGSGASGSKKETLSGTEGKEEVTKGGGGAGASASDNASTLGLGDAEGAEAGVLDLGQVQLHPSALDTLGGCFKWRIVEICYDVTRNPLGVQVTVKLFGFTVASAKLSTSHPCLNLNVGYSGAHLSGSICLQGNCCLVGKLELKLGPFGSYSWGGKLFCWC